MSTFKAEALADSPVFLLLLDEASGSSAADVGSNATAWTYAAGVTLGRPALVVGAATSAAPGPGGLAYLPSVPAGVGVKGSSLEAWVNIPDAQVNGHIAHVGSNASGWGFGVGGYGDTGGKGTHVQIILGNILWYPNLGQVTPGRRHLVVTYDALGNFRVFVDGIFTGLATDTRAVAPATGCTIGSMYTTAGGPANLPLSDTVSVAAVAGYPTVLSQSRITAHYLAGSGATSVAPLGGSADIRVVTSSRVGDDYATAIGTDAPLAHWPLGEAAGTSYALDSSPNGRHMFDSQGNFTRGVSGLQRQTLRRATTFSGGATGGYLRMAAASWMIIPNYSIELWTSFTGSAGECLISLDDAGGSPGQTRRRWTFSRSSLVAFQLYTTTGGVFNVASANINDGKPHHLVATVNDAAKQIRLYVDGVLAATTAYTGTLGGDATAQNPLTIGATYNNNYISGTFQPTTATIQDVAYYGTALTADQVMAHYAAGAGYGSAPIGVATSSNARIVSFADALEGKVLWLRASDLPSGSFSAWADRSGRGHDATGGSGTSLSAASTPNGGPSARFVAGALSLPDSLGLPSAYATSFYAIGGTFPASNLVDGSTATEWNAATGAMPQSVTFELTSGVLATSYDVVGSVTPAKSPKDWTLDGSNDGSNWTALDTRTGITGWTATESKTFAVAGSTSYAFYRMTITAFNGGSECAFAEFRLNGSALTSLAPVRDGEMWMVVKSDGGTGPVSWDFGADIQVSHYPYGGGVYEDFGSTVRRSFTPTLAVTSWRLYRVYVKGTDWVAALDGVPQLAVTTNAKAWSSAMKLGVSFNGNIAEVLIRNQVSTANEAHLLTAYFNEQHGLTAAYEFSLAPISVATSSAVSMLAGPPGATGTAPIGVASSGSAAVSSVVATGMSPFGLESTASALPAAIINDDFNRADTATGVGTASCGQAWTPSNFPGARILGNRLVGVLVASGDPVVTLDVGAPDHFVEAQLHTAGASDTSLVGRYLDDSNYWMAYAGPTTGGKWALYSKQAGAYVGSWVSLAQTAVAGDFVRLEFAGSTVTFSVNGVVLARVASTFNRSATRVGFRQGSGAAATWDNLSAAARQYAPFTLGTTNPLTLNTGQAPFTLATSVVRVALLYPLTGASPVDVPSVGMAYGVTKSTSPVGVATDTRTATPTGAAPLVLATSNLSRSDTIQVTLPVTAKMTAVAVQDGTASGVLPITAKLAGAVGAEAKLGVTARLAAQPLPTASLPARVGLTGLPVDGLIRLSLPISVGMAADAFHLGSLWMPIEVSETGTYAVNFSEFGVSNNPFPMYGDNDSRSAWFVFTATALETITVGFSAAFAWGLEVFTGPNPATPEDLAILGFNQGSVNVAVGPGQVVFMRVYPLSQYELGSGALTWTATARSASGTMEASSDPTIGEAPGWLRVSVAGATASGAVDFHLDGAPTAFTTGALNEAGVFVDNGIRLPTLTAGTHSLTVIDPTTSQSVALFFNVHLAAGTPSALPGSVGPSTPPSPAPVIKWVLEDPKPGGEVYTLPINPSQMSNPEAGRAIFADHTLSPTGHPIIWEGQPDPIQWSVEGAIETQAHLEAMERFYALQSRFYIVDHVQRVWTVVFETFDATPRSKSANAWSHTYRAKFLIVGGPGSLT